MKPSDPISHLQSPAYVAREEKHKAAQQIDDDMPELIDESDDEMPKLIDEVEVKVQHSTHTSKEEKQADDDFIKTAEMIANAPIQDVSLYYSKKTYCDDDERKSLIASVGSSGQTDVTLGSSNPRRAASQTETKTVGRSYLLDSDKQDRYKHMLFGSSLSRPSASSLQDTASQQYSSSQSILSKLANSRMVAGINTVGSWIADTPVVRGINSINPLVVVPEMLDEAQQLFARDDIAHGLASTGFAVLSAIPGDAAVVNMYKSGMTYLSGRLGMFGGRDAAILERSLFTQDTRGIEPASPELLEAIRSKGRTIIIAKPGSEEDRYLQFINAEANVGGKDLTHIILRENPSKPAVLEEFLHGTQFKLDIIDYIGVQEAEIHVKNFMIRHERMLGLKPEDINLLHILRDRDIDLLNQSNALHLR